MKKFLLLAASASSLFISSLQGAIFQDNATSTAQNKAAPGQTGTPGQASSQGQTAAPSPDMTQSAAVAQSWLQGVDNGDYENSWDQLGAQAQNLIKRNEWKQVLDVMRKPLGSVINRSVVNQSPAQNPQGLEPGDYMVLFYKTQFQNKPSAYELVTMHKSDDGKWKVLTYQVQ